MRTIHTNDGKTYFVRARQAWREGPPPEAGWWPASKHRLLDSLRFFDGKDWSLSCGPSCTAKKAGEIASMRDPYQAQIRWTDRWWLSEENKGERA